jgi:hypothetical protein
MRTVNNESDSAAYVEHQINQPKNRMKIGDLINHHGFLGIVTDKEDRVFVFETMYNGKPNGEVFSFPYDSLVEKDPKPCWTTEQ